MDFNSQVESELVKQRDGYVGRAISFLGNEMGLNCTKISEFITEAFGYKISSNAVRMRLLRENKSARQD